MQAKKVLQVGGIPKDITLKHIQDVFATYGAIHNLKFIPDNKAIVDYELEESARRALEELSEINIFHSNDFSIDYYYSEDSNLLKEVHLGDSENRLSSAHSEESLNQRSESMNGNQRDSIEEKFGNPANLEDQIQTNFLQQGEYNHASFLEPTNPANQSFETPLVNFHSNKGKPDRNMGSKALQNGIYEDNQSNEFTPHPNNRGQVCHIKSKNKQNLKADDIKKLGLNGDLDVKNQRRQPDEEILSSVDATVVFNNPISSATPLTSASTNTPLPNMNSEVKASLGFSTPNANVAQPSQSLSKPFVIPNSNTQLSPFNSFEFMMVMLQNMINMRSQQENAVQLGQPYATSPSAYYNEINRVQNTLIDTLKRQIEFKDQEIVELQKKLRKKKRSRSRSRSRSWAHSRSSSKSYSRPRRKKSRSRSSSREKSSSFSSKSVSKRSQKRKNRYHKKKSLSPRKGGSRKNRSKEHSQNRREGHDNDKQQSNAKFPKDRSPRSQNHSNEIHRNFEKKANPTSDYFENSQPLIKPSSQKLDMTGPPEHKIEVNHLNVAGSHNRKQVHHIENSNYLVPSNSHGNKKIINITLMMVICAIFVGDTNSGLRNPMQRPPHNDFNQDTGFRRQNKNSSDWPSIPGRNNESPRDQRPSPRNRNSSPHPSHPFNRIESQRGDGNRNATHIPQKEQDCKGMKIGDFDHKKHSKWSDFNPENKVINTQYEHPAQGRPLRSRSNSVDADKSEKNNMGGDKPPYTSMDQLLRSNAKERGQRLRADYSTAGMNAAFTQNNHPNVARQLTNQQPQQLYHHQQYNSDQQTQNIAEDRPDGRFGIAGNKHSYLPYERQPSHYYSQSNGRSQNGSVFQPGANTIYHQQNLYRTADNHQNFGIRPMATNESIMAQPNSRPRVGSRPEVPQQYEPSKNMKTPNNGNGSSPSNHSNFSGDNPGFNQDISAKGNNSANLSETAASDNIDLPGERPRMSTQTIQVDPRSKNHRNMEHSKPQGSENRLQNNTIVSPNEDGTKNPEANGDPKYNSDQDFQNQPTTKRETEASNSSLKTSEKNPEQKLESKSEPLKLERQNASEKSLPKQTNAQKWMDLYLKNPGDVRIKKVLEKNGTPPL